MSIITTERLTKILSETQEVITECNTRSVHGSVEVNARLFENVLMELLRRRAAMLQGADGNSPVIPDGLRLALSNAGIAAPESDEMLAATCEKYIQALVAWVKDRKPFQPAAPHFREIMNSSTNNFRENAETSTKCWCRTCRPVTISDMRFVVCPECGNKRCPHANDHRHACTGSNEPGQEGYARSSTEAGGVT